MRSRGLLVWAIVLMVVGLVGVIVLSAVAAFYSPSLRGDEGVFGPNGFDPRSMMGRGGMMNWMMRDFSKSSYSSNGERIFLTGETATGTVSAAGLRVRIGCANCHGLDGSGGLVLPDGTRSADIRWSTLTGEGFDEQIVKRAITSGVDEEGGQLSPYMPRWTMDPKSLDDIVAFLKTL